MRSDTLSCNELSSVMNDIENDCGGNVKITQCKCIFDSEYILRIIIVTAFLLNSQPIMCNGGCSSKCLYAKKVWQG